ncbi:glutathione S-transferase family protein [Paenirhodobacter populi]|uniref:Glutathione S-transferase n=1 Tax=Paenirhodobacter populi TaxID=2306993 RepID=A0A443J7Q6_9RHOB|nr:glutathione S-transferase [Sinirhodobacter populi]RWR05603.1 glutathione S-transferase [Sinirhodobacter populi]RWR16536.1 glutathione S-transferase [Sinirhodobacter populi]
MKLIGMLDSPYVRRVAISLAEQGLTFEHDPISVFSGFAAFAAINPVVKAPTLITDEGIVLMESTLILEHAALLAPDVPLAPAGIRDHAKSQRIIGLGLAACEKAVQIVYEHNLRPPEKRHAPWIDRVQGQLAAALRLLDQEIGTTTPWIFGPRMLQADITSAVAFRFVREMLPEMVRAGSFPALDGLSTRAEETGAFLRFPFR